MRFRKGRGGMIGYLGLQVGDFLYINSILVFLIDGEVSFSMPAKVLADKSLAPYCEITSKKFQQQVKEAIEAKLDEVDYLKREGGDNEK